MPDTQDYVPTNEEIQIVRNMIYVIRVASFVCFAVAAIGFIVSSTFVAVAFFLLGSACLLIDWFVSRACRREIRKIRTTQTRTTS